MDPITAVGFVAAVVQLIGVTSKVVNYFNDVKDAPKDRAKLAREAAGLLVLLIDLRYRVEETKPTDPWFTGLHSLGGPLMEFKSAMEDIADKLAPVTSFKRALRWTLDKKDIDATLSKIERLKTLVVLALQKDHFKLSLAMKKEITVGFQEIKTNRDVEKINRWLAAPLPSSNHNTAIKKKQPNTGTWFIQSKECTQWKNETGSFIWLHGIPGCGKTILCSTIIQDVVSKCQSEPSTAIVYFYFDFNDSAKQQTEMFIRSVVLQFAAQCPHLPELLQLAHAQSQCEQKKPTVDEMTLILRQMLKSFSTAYILLDALDECTDRDDLFDFIKILISWNISGLHMLATSRKENDIATSLDPLVTSQLCIQNELVNADILVFVLERLSNDTKLKRWPVGIQKEIESTLMKGANGMFRWVVCQLDTLRRCLNLNALRKALNSLPKTLDDTYKRMLSNLDEDYKEDALRILQWLCFSKRPMRLDEMVEVLAFDLASEPCRFRPDQRLLDPRDILTICSALVSVTTAATKDKSPSTTGSEELRLAHFSVKEYLLSDRLEKSSVHRYHITSSSANVSIAKMCLTYLHHFESPTILKTSKLDHEFPLAEYAAEYWPRHYKYITDDADRAAIDFLGYNLVESKNSCFINWLRIFNPERPWKRPDLELETNRVPFPLYYMSYLGINGIVQLLLEKGVNVNTKGGNFGHALSGASFGGHQEVVQLLLENGANVNAAGENFGRALSVASYGGHHEVVQLLLENGANVNAEGGYFGHALSAASFEGHKEVVQLLLENGANVNAEGGKYGNALSAASCKGHEETVRLLLANGADVNAQNGQALWKASKRGKLAVMRVLLENGADFKLAFQDDDEDDEGKALQGISVDD